MTPTPRTIDVALSIASHARIMGYRDIAVRNSKASLSCYVYFSIGLEKWLIRVSDHRIKHGSYDFDLPDLADIGPALEWMRKPFKRAAVMK